MGDQHDYTSCVPMMARMAKTNEAGQQLLIAVKAQTRLRGFHHHDGASDNGELYRH